MERRTFLTAALAATVLTPTTVYADSFRGQVTVKDITTPLVPTSSLRGDREFGGNGPIMDIRVELQPGRNGRAIFATVHFEAREDGGDGSHTRLEPRTFEVWRWKPEDGARFVESIDYPTWGKTVRSAKTCGSCAGAIDGAFPMSVAGTNTLRPVKYVMLYGDTMGDDISTDQNPHGDTHISRIAFNPINVRFTDQFVTN